MNSKHLNGLQVLNVDGGAKLGTVSRAYVDREAKRIAGFAYSAGGGFMRVESEPKLDTSEVRSLGPDALMIEHDLGDSGASVSERYHTLLVLDEMHNRPILTENGTAVGKIASIDFDNHSYELAQIEISPGYFKTHSTVPIDQVITVGPDYVIVDDAVCAPTAPVDEITLADD